MSRAVYDLLANVKVMQRGDGSHALAYILVVTGHFEQFFKKFLWEKVRVRINPHRVLHRQEYLLTRAFFRVAFRSISGCHPAQ